MKLKQLQNAHMNKSHFTPKNQTKNAHESFFAENLSFSFDSNKQCKCVFVTRMANHTIYELI